MNKILPAHLPRLLLAMLALLALPACSTVRPRLEVRFCTNAHERHSAGSLTWHEAGKDLWHGEIAVPESDGPLKAELSVSGETLRRLYERWAAMLERARRRGGARPESDADGCVEIYYMDAQRRLHQRGCAPRAVLARELQADPLLLRSYSAWEPARLPPEYWFRNLDAATAE